MYSKGHATPMADRLFVWHWSETNHQFGAERQILALNSGRKCNVSSGL
jgi:hypothetical protein